MNTSLKYIRYIIMNLTFIIALGVYLYVQYTVPPGILQTIRLTQLYAFLAVIYLYVALLASPLAAVFPNFFINSILIKARRAMGVSAFIFGFTHACFAFFGQLGGFAGLGFLNSTYITAILLSFIALVILAVMASTSFDQVIAKIGHSRWKSIHRFVYLAGILIIIHSLMLGTHFSDMSSLIPQLSFTLLGILLILEGLRLDKYLLLRYPMLPKFGIFFVIAVSSVIFWFLFTSQNSADISSFNIHSQHMQLARDLQKGPTTVQNTAVNYPGMQGDRTKRYTVSFNHQDSLQMKTDTPLHFQVYDASTGDRAYIFSTLYEKKLHLIIVDSQLEYFSHIHPTLENGEFTITTQFPHDGLYHLYLDFQPLGAIEQQFGFTITVGKPVSLQFSKAEPDKNLSKTFGPYRVVLSLPQTLKSSELAVAKQKLTFSIYTAPLDTPINTLKPYLGAYGHLVMINRDTFDYIHVHPSNILPPAPNSNGGPNVDFIPLGLYSPIKPGIYRVFAQFNPDNNLFTSDFTIKVE